jgi:hypothetical protein
MGLWSSIGHAVLQYGPYAAAPFTGGASLALAPAANAANAAWNIADQAKNSKGGVAGPPGMPQIKTMNEYGPSGMTKAGHYMTPQELQTAFPSGIPGHPEYDVNSIGPSNPSALAQNSMGMQQNSGNIFGAQQPTNVNTNSQLFNPTYGMMPQDSSNPNLSFALNQGKTNALMNQPWRSSRGIGPNIPPNQRQFQPAPMPQIPQATTFNAPQQG